MDFMVYSDESTYTNRDSIRFHQQSWAIQPFIVSGYIYIYIHTYTYTYTYTYIYIIYTYILDVTRKNQDAVLSRNGAVLSPSQDCFH